MGSLPDVLRSRSPNSRLRDHLRPPVIVGGLVQAVVMIVFTTLGDGMRPAVFAVGMIGPVVAAALTEPDAGWVDAPLAGLFGGCGYLLAILVYGAFVATGYEYVTATWVFGSYVTTTLSQAIMLLPAFVFFGLFVGAVVGGLKASWRRRRR